MQHALRRFVICILAGVLAIPFAGAPGEAAASDAPHVEGPIGNAGIWGHALWDSWYDLADVGYTEDEYFVSGIARSAASPGQTAPFTTRIIVARPEDPQRFNGTVLLDWVNVTAQFENAVDSVSSHEMLIRDGYAFVHASVQAAGICCTPLTPKVWDPLRYMTLSHPGDDYKFDIFSQIALAVRSPGTDTMAGLDVDRLIAAGQSQSASGLYGYVTQAQAAANVIDGFLIHGGGSKSYATPPTVPVLHLLSDSEASPSSPNTTTNYRLWEMGGASHSDFWIGYHQVFGQGPRALLHREQTPVAKDERLHVIAGNYGERLHPMQATCVLAGSMYPTRYVVNAAIHSLDRWIRTGEEPANSPRFEFDANSQLARDEHGNTRGGLRLPVVDVPVARYESTVCALGGITVPFTNLQLHQLYPTHSDYYSKVVAASQRSMSEGFLLPEDADDLQERACSAKKRWRFDIAPAACSP
ncbi:MAG: alpha/beta hydrolase domain-containing protein [Actinomycetota bacterium]